MDIAGYNFEGPWVLGANFNNVPGVYVVFTPQNWLDVGETDDAGQRLNSENHERKPQWISNSNTLQIYIAFLRMDDAQLRLTIESQLRQTLIPICGEK